MKKKRQRSGPWTGLIIGKATAVGENWTIINTEGVKFKSSAFGRIPLVPENMVTGFRNGLRVGRTMGENLRVQSAIWTARRGESASSWPDLHQCAAKEQPSGLNRDRDCDALLAVFDLAPVSFLPECAQRGARCYPENDHWVKISSSRSNSDQRGKLRAIIDKELLNLWYKFYLYCDKRFHSSRSDSKCTEFFLIICAWRTRAQSFRLSTKTQRWHLVGKKEKKTTK